MNNQCKWIKNCLCFFDKWKNIDVYTKEKEKDWKII